MALPRDLRAGLGSVLGASLVVLLVATACHRAIPPYSPEEARKAFQIESGYSIELVAAEPRVASPVALDFDEDGRMFVVEMPGYPLDTGPTGRIRLLEDRDGDGRFERSTRVRRRPRASHGGHALPAGRARHRRARRLVPRGRGRRRQGGEAREGAHRLRVLEPAAHGQLSRLRPRQLDPPRARGARGRRHLPRAVRRSRVGRCASPTSRGRPQLSRGPTRRALPARHARARGPLRQLAVRPRVRRVGPLPHPRQLESRAPRGDRGALPEAQSRPAP